MFNLYFAGGDASINKIVIDRKALRLLSYINEVQQIKIFCDEGGGSNLLVDSGAFSVAHNNKKVDIDEYIKYINNNSQIANFIELDIIPYPVLNLATAKDSAERSWENYLYMIERLNEPFKILPVFHFGEELKYLQRILEFQYNGKHIPFICIGGRHGVSVDKQSDYFFKVFKTIKSSSNPNVKVHILGVMVFDILEKFPFYSADGTTYLKIAIYGGIMTPFGILNISNVNCNSNNFKYIPDRFKDVALGIVLEAGYTIEDLSVSLEKRISFNIDYNLNWARNYKYKGLTDFKKVSSLF